jgi:multiple sugar transport system permease protein
MATRAAAVTTVAVREPRFPFRISRIIFLVQAVIFTILALTPFVLTVSGSFKTKSEILDWPPTIIPQAFQWQNYVEAWTNSHFAGAMFNAVTIILLVIFFQKYFIRSAASSAIKDRAR